MLCVCGWVVFVNLKVACKHEEAYEEYILLLKLIIYLFISFTKHVDIFRQFFSNMLVFTRTANTG